MSNQPEVEPSRAFNMKVLKGKFVKKQQKDIEIQYLQAFRLEAKTPQVLFHIF